MSSLLRALVLSLLLVACGSDSTKVDQPDGSGEPGEPDAGDVDSPYPEGFEPPPPPANGVQILGKPFTVQPGEDVFMCLYLDQPLTEDIDVSAMSAYQMSGGHHVILSWVANDFQPETDVHPCDDSEMVNHRMIGVGSKNPEYAIRAPEGVAFKAPGGKRLVIQSHYINASDTPREVMDAINLVGAPYAVEEYASQMVINDAVFELPPGQVTERNLTCTVTETSKVFTLTGHTHEWGEQFTLSRIPAGSDDPEVLFDVAVGEGFRDEPPLVNYADGAPLTLEPGDKLHMRCQWYNDTDEPMYYPKEMCAAPMFYYPSRGFEVCSRDGGTFDDVGL